MKRLWLGLLMIVAGSSLLVHAEEPRALIYTRNGPTLNGTKGFVHGNIATCVAVLQQLGKENGIATDVSNDPQVFTMDNLKKYRVVIFANSNNKAFDTTEQKAAFQQFIHNGGGFVGIHSASGSERDNEWFWALLGGTFKKHPKLQTFTIKVVDRQHPATAHYPEATFRWEDECYFLEHMPDGLHVLLAADLSTVNFDQKMQLHDPKFGADHPLAWCHEFEGGRSFYTALGHKNEYYNDPLFRKHLLGSIQWAMKLENTK